MATNKNQHFVPRCYLKEFTNDSANKAINVFNIDRKILIPLAPVKNQCSKDYFYGKNDQLEKAIQFVEQSYASTLRSIINEPQSLNEDHKIVLRRFLLLQYLRTEAPSKRAVEISQDMTADLGLPGEEFNLGIKEAVFMAMKSYAERIHIIDDLKLCLISNKTEYPFVTSDDPAVLSNRWHLNDDRTKFSSFGVTTSGCIFFLPLTPQIMCVAYDGDVYSIPNKKGWVNVTNVNDVKAFNQHQFLNCRANIFVKRVEDHPFINESFEDIEAHRPPERYRINYAILDFKEGDRSRFKVVDPKTIEDEEEALIHTQTIHCRPTSWPIVIRWRNKGAVYTNGTGMGYLRKYHILSEHKDFYKEPTKLRK